MKKILVLVVAAMLTTVNANAQNNYDNEIAVSYGGGSNADIVSSIGVGMFTGKQTDFWGPIGLEYFHKVSPSILVGGIATISGCKWDDSKDSKSTYFSLMPAVKWSWMQKEHFGMYSKAGIGVLYAAEKTSSKDDTRFAFDWQLSLIGMEFGGALRGFAELGMGEQGIILAGLRYKF